MNCSEWWVKGENKYLKQVFPDQKKKKKLFEKNISETIL